MPRTVQTLGTVVDAEIAALPKDRQAAFLRLVARIEAVGLERVGHPHVKHLRDKLWEMRFSGRDGIARAIYVTIVGQRVIVVHAFVKRAKRRPRPPLTWRNGGQRRSNHDQSRETPASAADRSRGPGRV